jgi:hypothetical protein
MSVVLIQDTDESQLRTAERGSLRIEGHRTVSSAYEMVMDEDAQRGLQAAVLGLIVLIIVLVFFIGY